LNEWDSVLPRYKKLSQIKLMPRELRILPVSQPVPTFFDPPLDPHFARAYIAAQLWQSSTSSAKIGGNGCSA